MDSKYYPGVFLLLDPARPGYKINQDVNMHL
jgi:5S rRNA maturation endonuclease (ribonuclease M5)